MAELLIPFGYPNTKLAGTEIAGKNIDPISGECVAPNGTVFPNRQALNTAQAASIATGHSAFALWR